MKWFHSIVLFPILVFSLDTNFEIENTNIFSFVKNSKYNDYNKTRIYSTIKDSNYENFLGEIIIDNYNLYDRNITKNSNKTKIYRAYLKYSDEKQIVTLGKQRVPFGVGRVWNPIDIYNPLDATALDLNARKGVEAIRYEYALNELSNIDATISKDKYALRTKGYLNFADIALLALKDNKNHQDILGYEIQGEFLDTGIELRSEGGYFLDKENKDYEEFIIGAEYRFENSLNILGEYKYNSLNNLDYLATNLSYTISTLWNCSYLGIINLDDKSTISIGKLSYSLSDESELDFGTYLYTGNKTSEYGKLNNSLFTRFFIHF